MSWASWRRSFGAVGNFAVFGSVFLPKTGSISGTKWKDSDSGPIHFWFHFWNPSAANFSAMRPKTKFSGRGGLSKHTLHPTCLYTGFGSFLARRSCIGAGLVG